MKRLIRVILSGIACLGCTSAAVRSQSPEDGSISSEETALVGELARPYGLEYIQVESVSLATGLNGHGEDPPPSPQRAVVLDEMRRRNIPDAAQVLRSLDTGLVVVRAYLRPGIQIGDHFDVEVRVPSRSETESLRGGWLLESRMTELAVLDQQIRSGRLLALAEGPVLVDPSDDNDPNGVHQTRGRVLGGGVALKSRSLGLVLYDEHQSVRTSQQIGRAINRRFHTYVRGDKLGVANPKTDQFVELIVHPRYKNNIQRYVQVVRNVAYRETPRGLQVRLALLERQLLDPVTTATAALRLESIGTDSIDILRRGMNSSDPEVRFYSAEAMAYLDETDAAETLGQMARDEPAFRAHALAALSALDGIGAHDQLVQLMDKPSAETRYGAFRSLWTMDPTDPMIRGEMLGSQFSYHVLEVKKPAMIHVTRSQRPEIVLFGHDLEFDLPITVEAGPAILVTGSSGDRITVSRFSPGEPDQKRNVSRKVDAVIRAVVDLGGTYPDAVQLLQQAKAAGALSSRLRVDALPDTGRRFRRPSEDSDSDVPGPGKLPDLFRRLTGST